MPQLELGPPGLAISRQEGRGDAPVLTLRFGPVTGATLRPDGIDIALGLEPLEIPEGREAAPELWYAAGAVRTEQIDDLMLAHAGDRLVGCWYRPHGAAEDPGAITEQAYHAILEACQERGFGHLVRAWNYFPAINQELNGQERYRSFCAGRARVFEALPDFERHLPAATAIGTHADGMLIYFIAMREATLRIENPRQVSAFRYPRQYGPRSPSFARARMSQEACGAAELFISGTASIVGHESRHAEDLEAQIDESLRNIGVLLAAASEEGAVALRDPGDLSMLKVYLRHRADGARAQRHLRECLGEDVDILLLHGDICRSELLVEIEGLYREG